MHISLRFMGLACFALCLSGCSYFQNAQALRNRTFDYTQQNVANLPPLQTPSGLTTPQFSPQFTLPAGQNDYPPGSPPVMTPPGFADSVVIPELPPKVKPANS